MYNSMYFFARNLVKGYFPLVHHIRILIDIIIEFIY